MHVLCEEMTTYKPIKIPSKIIIPQVTITPRIKNALIGLGIGITVIGLLARYFRRRRRNIPAEQLNKPWPTKLTKPIDHIKSPNGDISSYSRRSMSPSFSRSYFRQGSVSLASDHHSTLSTVASTVTLEATGLTPQQLGLMGMEALETAVGYWEDALHSYTSPISGDGALAITSEEESEFSHHVEKVLEMSYALQERCEQLFLHQTSVLFRSDSVSDRFVDVDRYTVTSISSLDSFVSAVDMIADLREFDEFPELNQDFQHLPLYQTALRQLEEGGIPYRTLRTEYLKCQTDIDYLAKIHCVRLAFQFVFEDEKVKTWFIECGRQMISDLLLRADKDPKDFLIAYDEMLAFVKNDHHFVKTEEELRGRGVRCMTFYDIVLDYIFLDAFEDLENPPSSVMAVVQNRWLSNGFKETALSTAVWSVLKAKRKFLKFPDGFIAHFYNISEHTSPVLAWGFLGPEERLKELCNFFKDQVLGFLLDIFNSEKSRYTTVEELSASILSHAQQHYAATQQRLSL